MIQFDDIIFLNWIGSTTNSIYLEVFQFTHGFLGHWWDSPIFFPWRLRPRGGSLKESADVSLLNAIQVIGIWFTTSWLLIYGAYVYSIKTTSLLKLIYICIFLTYIVYIVSMYIYIVHGLFIYDQHMFFDTYCFNMTFQRSFHFLFSSAPRSRSWTLWTSSATRMLASKKRRGTGPVGVVPGLQILGAAWRLVLSPVFATLLFVPFFWRFGVWGKFGGRRQKTVFFFCNNDLGVVEASFWREGSSLQGLVFKRNKGIWDDNHQHIWQ